MQSLATLRAFLKTASYEWLVHILQHILHFDSQTQTQSSLPDNLREPEHYRTDPKDLNVEGSSWLNHTDKHNTQPLRHSTCLSKVR
jgi:hypothetical protein